jgi:hypothetical protein
MKKIHFFCIFLLGQCSILSALNTATRDLPDTYTPGSSFQVTIDVETDPVTLPTGVVVTEFLPAGWSIVSASPFYYKYKSEENSYKWLEINRFGVVSFIITYTVSVPQDASGTYEFSGFFKPGDIPIAGDSSIGQAPFEIGDINKNYTIDISDVILCLRMAVGLNPMDLSIANMNDDEVIDISDVILLLRKAIGLD